jgi:hypothetical protein
MMQVNIRTLVRRIATQYILDSDTEREELLNKLRRVLLFIQNLQRTMNVICVQNHMISGKPIQGGTLPYLYLSDWTVDD